MAKITLGKHWIVEYYDCEEHASLADPNLMEELLLKAAELMNATIVKTEFHHFTPLGVSGVIIIQESHLTVHTWPEHNYAAVDVFTCGEMDPELGIEFLANKLGAGRQEVRVLNRGVLGVRC